MMDGTLRSAWLDLASVSLDIAGGPVLDAGDGAVYMTIMLVLRVIAMAAVMM